MEYSKGREVIAFSRYHGVPCNAEITKLPGERKTLDMNYIISDGEREIEYKKCGKEIFTFYDVLPLDQIALIPTPKKDKHRSNPCENKKDGEKPSECPSDRPICKQNVCSVDIYDKIMKRKDKGKGESDSTLFHGDIKPKRERQKLPPVSTSKQRRRLRYKSPEISGVIDEYDYENASEAIKKSQFSRVTRTHPRKGVDLRGSFSETGEEEDTNGRFEREGGGRKINNKKRKNKKNYKKSKKRRKSKTKRRS